MRTYDQLTPEEQAQACEIAVEDLLKAIIEGGLRFNDKLNHDDFQKRIDAAWQKADEMQTPWFASSYIMDTCREEIEGMAACDAEDALYPAVDEWIIRLPVAK